MDPNQQYPPQPEQPQPAPQPQPQYQQAPQQPVPSPALQPMYQPERPIDTTPQQFPQQTQMPQPLQQSLPSAPQTPTSYQAPPVSYDPNYLDSIAPPPPRASFLSGSFGKIFFGLLAVVVLIVSFIVAFGGKDNTADLQQVTVRVTNFAQIIKAEQPYLTSNNLSSTNTNFATWVANTQTDSTTLLKIGGVQKSMYNKTMVASEKTISTNLTAQFEDARLNAVLNRVYASTMAAETQKLLNLLNSMAKKTQSSKIRDFAKNASTNLVPLQKAFESYTDDGN